MITRAAVLSDGRLLCCITVFLVLLGEADFPLHRQHIAAGYVEGGNRFNLPDIANGPCQGGHSLARRRFNALLDGLAGESCPWPSGEQYSVSMLQSTRTVLPKIGQNGEVPPEEEENTTPEPHLGASRHIDAQHALPLQLSKTGHHTWIKQDTHRGVLEAAVLKLSQLAERWSNTVKHAWSHRSEVCLFALKHLHRISPFDSPFTIVAVVLLLLIMICGTVVACMEVRCQWTEFRDSIISQQNSSLSTGGFPNDHATPEVDRRSAKSRTSASSSKQRKNLAQPFLNSSLVSGQISPQHPLSHRPASSLSPQSEQCSPELFGPCLCPELVVPHGNECKLELPRLPARSSEPKGQIFIRDLSDKPVFKVDFDLIAAPARGGTHVDRLILSCAKRHNIFAICQECTERSANEIAINHPGGTLFGKVSAKGNTRADGFSLAIQADAREVYFSAIPNSTGLEATDEHGQLLSVTVPLDEEGRRSVRIGPFVDAGLAVASILAVDVLEFQLMQGTVQSKLA